MDKTSQNRITIVGFGASAQEAVITSVQKFQPAEALLFLPENGIEGYHSDYYKTIHSYVPFKEYHNLAHVVDFIKTTHYIVVSKDSYITNPTMWDNSFLDYHYIGGLLETHPNNNLPPHPICTNDNRMGDGKFSLRSALMMRNVKSLFLDMLRDPGFSPLQWSPEDFYICRTLRPILENLGYKFAPDDVANKFSTSKKYYNNSFGIYV